MSNWKFAVGVMFGLFLAVTLVYTGCQSSTPIKQPESGGTLVVNVQDGLKKDADTLGKTTAKIKEDAKAGQKATPPDAKPALDPYWLDILLQAGTQDQLVLNLMDKSEQLGQANEKISGLEKFASGETARANAAEEREKSADAKVFRLMMLIGGIGVAAAAALIWSGIKFGIPFGIGSAVLTVLGIFLSQAYHMIAYGVGGLILLCIGLAIYFFVKHQQENKTKTEENRKLDKANTQLVTTVEQTKQMLTVQGRRKLFGEGAIYGLVHAVQDDETKEIVKKKRLAINHAPELPARPAIDYDGDGIPDDDLEQARATKRRLMARRPAPDADIWTAHMG